MFCRSLCEIDAIERVIVECCGMQRYTLQIAFLAFDISSTSKKLTLNSYLWVKSTIILAKSIFLSDASHICLSVATRET